jgi:uncharacterized protein
MSNSGAPHYANGKICYLEIPSRNAEESAAFYQHAFDWKIRKRGDGRLAFDDGVGEVSGTWRTDRSASPEIGILIYIMVNDIEATIKKVIEQGGTIVQPVGMDAPELTARFRDLSGNVMGIYEERG